MKTSKLWKLFVLSKVLFDMDCSMVFKFFCCSFLCVLYCFECNFKLCKLFLSCFFVMTFLSFGFNELNALCKVIFLECVYVVNFLKFIYLFLFEFFLVIKLCMNDVGIFKDFAYVFISRCEMYSLFKVSMRLKSCFRCV